MINEKELEISNKSYINKDFQTIYPELLSMVSKLTNRWNPETSNESDPGLVLLKLLAFIGDKNSYNIDKNVLECFMPSATQESSMRKLCDMMGYNMKYYRSATTDITFTYMGGMIKGNSDSFTLKAFDTCITDIDNTVIYTLVQDLDINAKGINFIVPAIEGTIQTLRVADKATIQLENIDANNRVYFPETLVAENGIFIQNSTDANSYWDKVDNLNNVIPGTYCYRFGYDSIKGLPYVEFPSDIASLIGSGINIRYIRTSGHQGNVKAGYLTTLYTPTTIKLNKSGEQVYPEISEDESNANVLVITNSSGTNTGLDPETINDAYNGFKKTIGTFDTLVTCRDYANFIYNMIDEYGSNMVSNTVVTDRRTDYNYSNLITTFSEYGITQLNNVTNSTITPFDLCLYPLKPITTSYTYNSFKQSFEPLDSTLFIKNELEDAKSISHDYKVLRPYDVYCFKNYYSLNAKISTTYKVNLFEQNAILTNINNALYVNFNARKLDYGYEIPYDSLLNVITSADSRIKSVSLEEPKVTPFVMLANGIEYKLSPETQYQDGDKIIRPYYDLITKNIISNRVSLFNYDTRFAYEFGQGLISDNGQPVGPLFEKLKSISTSWNCNLSDFDVRSGGYHLRENEVIQIVSPNLITEYTYPYGINYCWESDNTMVADTEYKLQGNDILYINYTNSNDIMITIKYTADTVTTYNMKNGVEKSCIEITLDHSNNEYNIFKPNFNVVPTTYRVTGTDDVEKATPTKKIKLSTEQEQKCFYTIASNEEILKRKFVTISLKNQVLPCYWVRTNVDNQLFTDQDAIKDSNGEIIGYQVILGENEYFIYSNSALTSLEILGSGARLTIFKNPKSTANIDLVNDWRHDNAIDLATINDKGVAAFDVYNWKYVSLGENSTINEIKLEELQVLTLVEGDTLSISDVNNSNIVLDNTFKDLGNEHEIQYYLGDSTDLLTLPKIGIDGVNWQIRSRLDLNVGPYTQQPLLGNHIIDVVYDNNKTVQLNSNLSQSAYFMVETNIQRAGGVNIDMATMDLVTNEPIYNKSLLFFEYQIPTYNSSDGKGTKNIERVKNYINLQCREIDENDTNNIILNLLPLEYDYNSGKNQLLMIYWKHIDSPEAKITIVPDSVGNGSIALYNNESTRVYYENETIVDGKVFALHSGLNIVDIDNLNQIRIVLNGFASTSQDLLIIGPLTHTLGFNKLLGLANDEEEFNNIVINEILPRIKSRTSQDDIDLFYYNIEINNSTAIDEDTLNSGAALWNLNNIANRCTIAQLDFRPSYSEYIENEDGEKVETKVDNPDVSRIEIVRTSKL